MATEATLDEIVEIITNSKRKLDGERIPLKLDVVYIYDQEVHTAHRAGPRLYRGWFCCMKVKDGARRHFRLKKKEVEQARVSGRMRDSKVEFLTDDEHFRRCLDFRNLLSYRPHSWP